MEEQFDELTKGMAQSVTRRGALKRLGLGLAGMALAAFGLATTRAKAASAQGYCQVSGAFYSNDLWYTGICVDINGCITGASANCPSNGTLAGSIGKSGLPGGKFKEACGSLYTSSKRCSFTV